MIFQNAILESAKKDEKKKTGVLDIVKIIGFCILSIIAAIIAIPIAAIASIFGSSDSDSLLKELNKHPKAKKLFLQAAKKMQDGLKKSIDSKFVIYNAIKDSDIKAIGSKKNGNSLYIKIAHIDVDKLIKHIHGKTYKELINDGLSDDDIIYNNDEFTKEYFYIKDTLEKIRSEIKKYPNGVVMDLDIEDDYGGHLFTDKGIQNIYMEIRFKDYESLEKTPEIAKLKEAVEMYMSAASILNEMMDIAIE